MASPGPAAIGEYGIVYMTGQGPSARLPAEWFCGLCGRGRFGQVVIFQIVDVFEDSLTGQRRFCAPCRLRKVGDPISTRLLQNRLQSGQRLRDENRWSDLDLLRTTLFQVQHSHCVDEYHALSLGLAAHQRNYKTGMPCVIATLRDWCDQSGAQCVELAWRQHQGGSHLALQFMAHCGVQTDGERFP